MQNLLTTLRKQYFKHIANSIAPKQKVQFIVLTHILEDRPDLLFALQTIAPINLLIAIPYSIHKPTLSELQPYFNIATPSLNQLYEKKFLKNIVLDNIDQNTPLIILEIGGYFAPIIQELYKELNGNLIGTIEDTEAGHRQYEHYSKELPCPIISVARSALKETEDFLVGTSCLFSTEKLLRAAGVPLEGKSSFILGFGKVGRGLSHALSRRNCPVSVYDIDPIKRINALSEGFQIPSKQEALTNADVIYGATGKCAINELDFQSIKNGAFLISCSSKDTEFYLPHLKLYNKKTIIEGLDRYQRGDKFLYLAYSGRPVNFIDGAVIGPILALVQSEIIYSIKLLMERQGETGIIETDNKAKQFLAETWLQYFCDEKTGQYELNTDKLNKNSLKNTMNISSISKFIDQRIL